MHLTAYTNKGISGITTSGYPAGYDSVAVDRTIYKLKWKSSIALKAQGCKWHEFDIPHDGRRIAHDTGSAVGGYELDLWFKTEGEGKAFLRKINPKLKPNGEYANVTVYECSTE